MPRQNTLLAELRGALDLAGEGFDQVTARTHEWHRAISDLPFEAIEPIPGAGEGGAVVRVLHDGITDGVYATVRAVGGLAFGVARAAIKSVEHHGAEASTHPVRDDLVCAVSGVVGDYMAKQRNPLAVRAGVYASGRRVPLERGAVSAAFPEPTAELAIFVHGLCCNESTWRMYTSDEPAPRVPYPDALRADQGLTPVMLRYNSGLRVPHNGRTVARVISAFIAAYPVPVTRVVLIGHSMGGLVVRAACHAAQRRSAAWTRLVTQVVCLGSPHRGAPLEQVVHVGARLLGSFALGKPWARVLQARSVGIQDLREGVVSDQEAAPPRLAHAAYHFIGSTIGASERDPLGQLVGDGMVRLPSATARELADADTAVLHRLHHLDLLNHPAVYRELAARLQEPSSRPRAVTA